MTRIYILTSLKGQ